FLGALPFEGQFAQREVKAERNPESDKPGVVVKRNEKCRDASGVDQFHGHKKTGKIRQDGGEQRDERDDTEAAGVTMLGVVAIKRVEIQMPSPDHEIIRDH